MECNPLDSHVKLILQHTVRAAAKSLDKGWDYFLFFKVMYPVFTIYFSCLTSHYQWQ